MPYTPPPTFADSTTLPADDLNVLSEDIEYLFARFLEQSGMGVRTGRATNQSIPDDTPTAVIFTDDEWDDGDAHTDDTAPVVIPASWIPDGYSTIRVGAIAVVSYATNSSGDRETKFAVNGETSGRASDRRRPAASGPTRVPLSDEMIVAAGDEITVLAYQDRGSSLNVVSAGLSVRRIGLGS